MPPRSSLVDATRTVRLRVERARAAHGMNEENTKATLIEPILRALGWDVEDFEEVQREYRVKRRDRPVDYALLLRRTPRLFIEAKALGQDLADRRWSSQIMGYAAVAGVEWVVLTDGDEYRIYNAHATVDVDQKILRTFKISDDEPAALECLRLLTRDMLQENRLAVLWKAHYVDRQVGEAIRQLLDVSSGGEFLALLRRSLPSLAPSEVRASLGRARLEISFPPVAAGEEAVRTRRAPALRLAGVRRKSPAAVPVTIADLIRDGALSPPVPLSRRYRGTMVTALIEPDGSISIGRERFDSLSTAASVARRRVLGALGRSGEVETNGWAFWKCEVDGVQRTLDEVRRAHLAQRSVHGAGVRRVD